MPRSGGYRTDKGGKFAHVDKPLKLVGASWVEPMGSTVLWEDFLIDVLADSPWVTATQSGTPLTAAAIDNTAGAPTAGHGGWVGGKTDDVAAEIDEVAFGGLGTGAGLPPFFAARAGNGVMVSEFGFVIPTALTARQYYVGWSDDPTEGTTAAHLPLNIATAYTVTSQATDAAGFVFSSLATAPTIWKYGSVNNDTDSAWSAATEAVTGVVDAYTVCRVEIDSAGNAYFYQSTSGSSSIGRQEPVAVGSQALAVRTTVGLLGYFGAQPTTTTGVEWELDYCFLSSAR